MAFVTDTREEKKKKYVADVLMVREFPHVFPDDLPGIRPERQVEFRIDLGSGGGADSKSPVPVSTFRDAGIVQAIRGAVGQGVYPSK